MSQADKVLKRVQGDLTVSTHSDIPPQMGAIQRVILDDIFTVLRSGGVVDSVVTAEMIEVLRALPGDFDRMRTMLTSRVSYLDSEIASLRAEEGNINKHVIDPATIIHLRLRLGTIAAQIARFNADKILVNTLLSGGNIAARSGEYRAFSDRFEKFKVDGQPRFSGQMGQNEDSFHAYRELVKVGSTAPHRGFFTNSGERLRHTTLGGHSYYSIGVQTGGVQKQLLIDVTDMQVDGHGVVRIPPDVTLYDIDIDSTVTRGASIGVAPVGLHGTYSFDIGVGCFELVPGTPAMRFVHAKQLHVERSATHVRERGVWFDDLNVTGTCFEVERILTDNREKYINHPTEESDIQRGVIAGLVEHMPDFSTLDKAGQDAFLGQLQSLPAHLNTNPGGDSLWVLEQPPAPLGSSTTFMTDPDGLFTQLRTFVLEQVSGQDFSQAGDPHVAFQLAVQDILNNDQLMRQFLEGRVQAILADPGYKMILRDATVRFHRIYTEDEPTCVRNFVNNLGRGAHVSHRGSRGTNYGVFFAGSGPMSEEHRVGEQSYSLEVDANQQDQIKATVKIGDRSISVFGQDHLALCNELLTHPDVSSGEVRAAKLKTHIVFAVIKGLLRLGVRDIPGEMEFYIHNTATPTKRVVKFTADGTMTMITRVYDPLGRTGTGSGNWIDTTDFDEKKFNASQDFQALVTSATNLSAHFTQCVNSRRADLETAMDDNDLMQHHIEGVGFKALFTRFGSGRKLSFTREITIGDQHIQYNFHDGKHFFTKKEKKDITEEEMLGDSTKNLRKAIHKAGLDYFAVRILDEVHHGLIEDLQTKVKAKNPRFAGVWATHPHTQDKYVLRPDGSWVVVRRHSPAWARVGSGNHGILRNRLVSAEILDPDVPAHKSVIDGVYMTMPVIGGIARELRRQL